MNSEFKKVWENLFVDCIVVVLLLDRMKAARPVNGMRDATHNFMELMVMVGMRRKEKGERREERRQMAKGERWGRPSRFPRWVSFPGSSPFQVLKFRIPPPCLACDVTAEFDRYDQTENGFAVVGVTVRLLGSRHPPSTIFAMTVTQLLDSFLSSQRLHKTKRGERLFIQRIQ
jgi:hypothetical protein